MRQHLAYAVLGQAPDPSLLLDISDPPGVREGLRLQFERNLAIFSEAVSQATTEVQIQTMLTAFMATYVAPLSQKGLWNTAAEAEKDTNRIYAIANAKIASLKGFMGIPWTWILVGGGLFAGWWFWKKSKA